MAQLPWSCDDHSAAVSYLNAHGLEALLQSFAAVLSIIGQQQDLHLGQTLGIPGRGDPYGPVIAVVGAFCRLLGDEGLPADTTLP